MSSSDKTVQWKGTFCMIINKNQFTQKKNCVQFAVFCFNIEMEDNVKKKDMCATMYNAS